MIPLASEAPPEASPSSGKSSGAPGNNVPDAQAPPSRGPRMPPSNSTMLAYRIRSLVARLRSALKNAEDVNGLRFLQAVELPEPPSTSNSSDASKCAPKLNSNVRKSPTTGEVKEEKDQKEEKDDDRKMPPPSESQSKSAASSAKPPRTEFSEFHELLSDYWTIITEIECTMVRCYVFSFIQHSKRVCVCVCCAWKDGLFLLVNLSK